MTDMIRRRNSRTAQIGSLKIGGNYPVSVQSMTNCDVRDLQATINQIRRLESAGCDVVRIAFPDIESCHLIPMIKKNTHIPIMADIHFDHSIALEAMEYNIDGIRINPGNIKKEFQFIQVMEKARKKNVMIRFGINAGSLNKKILEKFKEPNVEAMVAEAFQLIAFLDKIHYHNIVLSIKSSNVLDTIRANEIIAQKCEYPMHIGITEAGFDQSGIIKSTAGISILLYQGIGDTIRVSLSGDPEKEVMVGYDILRSLGIRRRGINMITCPTCGRCQVDIQKIGREIENKLKDIQYPFTVAVMGCVVNGPGEARIADAGIAFNQDEAMLFRRGQLIGRFHINDSAQALIREVRTMANIQNNIR